MQDHKIFARHDKFGTIQVPKEFLTNQKAPVAVAPNKAVQQACRASMDVPSLTRHARLASARSDKNANPSPQYLPPLTLHLGRITHRDVQVMQVELKKGETTPSYYNSPHIAR